MTGAVVGRGGGGVYLTVAKREREFKITVDLIHGHYASTTDRNFWTVHVHLSLQITLQRMIGCCLEKHLYTNTSLRVSYQHLESALSIQQ